MKIRKKKNEFCKFLQYNNNHDMTYFDVNIFLPDNENA